MAADVTPTPSRTTAKKVSPSRRRAHTDLRSAPNPHGPLAAQTVEANRHSIADVPPVPKLSPQDCVDFLLHPAEIAKGRRAAENYLSTFRTEESRRAAEDMLETLATVISGGKCDSVEFPWQQVRPYHGAAALTILKERGAPARIETLRCRKNSSRSFRAVPPSFPPREVQKIRTTLTRVIEECDQLGFLVGETASVEVRRSTTTKRRPNPAPRSRLLADGELRALVATCAAEGTAKGARDAVFFALVYRGLRIAEIVGLTLASVRFSNKSGVCTIAANGGGRGRRVELSNDELIVLEDWLDERGSGDGPLLGSFGKTGQLDGKRLTTAMLIEMSSERARQAEVAPFTPTDLSKSADALHDHRKLTRRTAARESEDFHTAAERVLFEAESSPTADSEMIRFPFLGLGI